jgi:hypothetical protein
MELAMNGGVTGTRFTFESEILIEAAALRHTTLAVPILAHYPRESRPSHFRPIVDIARIVVMVGGSLLRKGMYPLGLWRSLKPAPLLPGRASRITAGRGQFAVGWRGDVEEEH